MKKSLVLMAMAGMALSSCVNDVADVVQKEQKAAKITFDAPVMYNSAESRTPMPGEIEGVYPTGEKFVVYGVAHTGNFTTWAGSADLETLMNGVTVAHNGDLNGWAPATDVLWPYYKRCTFAAYSPADIDGDVTGNGSLTEITYGTGGLVIPGYQIPDVGSQYDLMYTPREYNRTTSYHAGTTYNGVPLTFKHALSSIHFALVSSHSHTVTLKSIAISGLCNKATFSENITEGASYEANPEWTEFTGEETYQIFTHTDGHSVNFPTEMRRLGYIMTSVGLSDDHGLLAIPQNLTNAKLIVKYRIDGESDDTTKEINLSSYFGNQWLMGTRYYYVLSIGAASSKIYFAPVVDAWGTDDTVIQLQ